jgi:hypothetical protein
MSDELSGDLWISGNSPIEASKLHALGAMNFHWNIVAQLLQQILANLRAWLTGKYEPLSLTERQKISKKTAEDLIKAIRKEAKDARLYQTENSNAYIEKVLDATDVCRDNRNGLTHYVVINWYSGDTSDWRLVRDWTSEPLPDDLVKLRKTAEDMQALWNVMQPMLCELSILWGLKQDQLQTTVPTPVRLFPGAT